MLDLETIKGRHDERRKLEKALTLGNDDTVELIAEIERLRAELAEWKSGERMPDWKRDEIRRAYDITPPQEKKP